MIPESRFTNQPRYFWANVRTIGQAIGYTVRRRGLIKVPTADEIRGAYTTLGLSSDHLFLTMTVR